MRMFLQAKQCEGRPSAPQVHKGAEIRSGVVADEGGDDGGDTSRRDNAGETARKGHRDGEPESNSSDAVDDADAHHVTDYGVDPPVVSVIVPVHNAAPWLDETLGALLAQEEPESVSDGVSLPTSVPLTY